jgi:hypothetical protein
VRFKEPGEISLTDSPGWNNDLGTDRIRNPNGRLCGIIWQRVCIFSVTQGAFVTACLPQFAELL